MIGSDDRSSATECGCDLGDPINGLLRVGYMTIGVLILGEYAPTRSCPERRPWVAKLLGISAKHNYDREFLDSQKDWSNADKKGRGVTHCYNLEEGCLYEVCRWRKRDKSERYFVRVDSSGDIVGVRHDDVDRILREAQCARDERIRQSLAALEDRQNVLSASMC